jgi:hypothetical protein
MVNFMHGHAIKNVPINMGPILNGYGAMCFFILLNAPYEPRVTPHGICYMPLELEPLLSPLKVDKVGKFQAYL